MEEAEAEVEAVNCAANQIYGVAFPMSSTWSSNGHAQESIRRLPLPPT